MTNLSLHGVSLVNPYPGDLASDRYGHKVTGMTSINPLDLAVSAVLRGRQAQKNVTNIYLSTTTGIHPRTLIRILGGQRAATVGELRLLATALGTTASQIAVEAEWMVEDV